MDLNTTFFETPKFVFTWIDYTVFTVLLSLSILIGIYFGFFGSKQNSTVEYLLGGKNMNTIPVSISLIASYISGITILAVPTDVYRFGANYIWICLSMAIACLATMYIYLPVFFKLQYTTIFEYLNDRFDKKTRILASFLFTFTLIMYSPIVMYIPALAFSQVTGINVHYITPVVTIVCIFYTTIGGLKTVIWTDALQFIGILVSTVTVVVMGLNSTGGWEFVIKKNIEGHRLDLLNFEFDLTIRDSFWAFALGGTIFWLCQIATHQGSLQKYLAVPTLSQAKTVVAICCSGMIFLSAVGVLTGNILYAKYYDCDPLKSKQIIRGDQILPLFVMDVAGSVPGMPGIFIGGIFSAALSTLSASLNTISGTIYGDFVLPFMPPNTTEKTASCILKLIVIIAGVACILLVFVIENMGSILPLVTTFQGVTGGPIIALFTLGVLFPHTNAKGAFYGGLFGVLVVSWIAFTNLYYSLNGMLVDFSKTVSVEGCTFYVNTTRTTTNTTTHESPFILYKLPFWYNSLIGMLLVIISSLIISWFTYNENDIVHPDFVNPISHFMIPRTKCKKLQPNVFQLKAHTSNATNTNQEEKLLQNGITSKVLE